MDWASILKDYGLLVTAGIGILGILLKYYLDGRTSRKIRKLSLLDKKIEEAKAQINAYQQITQLLVDIELGFATSKNVSLYKANEDKIFDLMNVTPERLKSINSLGDSKLRDLHAFLRILINNEQGKVHDLKLAVIREQPINDKDVTESAINFSSETGRVIGQIYDRIEKISTTVL